MSWQQVLDIGREAFEEHRAATAARPLACPNDGEPLQEGPGGVLHCRFDGWTYPQDQQLT